MYVKYYSEFVLERPLNMSWKRVSHFCLLLSQRCLYFITVYKVYFLKYTVNYGFDYMKCVEKLTNTLKHLW